MSSTQESSKEKSITVVVDAYSTSDHEDGPAYAAFTVNQNFIDRIKDVQGAIEKHKLSGASIASSPEMWGPKGIEDELRLRNPELHIDGPGGFYFQDYPKHGSPIESRGKQVEAIATALADANDGDVIYLGDQPEMKNWYLEDIGELPEPDDDDEFIRVEFDPQYTGGDYSGSGQFALIPVKLIEKMAEQDPNFGDGVGQAFTKVTKLDCMHIVHYTTDEHYDKSGEMINDEPPAPRG